MDNKNSKKDIYSEQRIKEIAKIIIDVLDNWSSNQANKKPKIVIVMDFITKYFIILGVFASLISLIILYFVFNISPWYYFEEIGYKQEEYKNSAKMREYKNKMAIRRLNLGKELLNVAHYEAAEKEFKEVLTVDHYNIDAQLSLLKAQIGLDENKENNPEVIDKKLQLIFDENKDDPHALVFRGNLHKKLRDFKSAKEQYVKANIASAYCALGETYYEEGNNEEAIKWFKKASESSCFCREYLINLANLYYENRKYHDAEETYYLKFRTK